jgi:hypothetical protein
VNARFIIFLGAVALDAAKKTIADLEGVTDKESL